ERTIRAGSMLKPGETASPRATGESSPARSKAAARRRATDLMLLDLVARERLSTVARHQLVQGRLVDRGVHRLHAAIAEGEVDLAGVLAPPVDPVIDRPVRGVDRDRTIDGSVDVGPNATARGLRPDALRVDALPEEDGRG